MYSHAVFVLLCSLYFTSTVAEFVNFYEVLEVEERAGATEIKKSFRKMAMKWHPDKNKDKKLASEKMKVINEAYATLSDETKRDAYDRLKAKIAKFGEYANWASGGEPRSRAQMNIPTWAIIYFACPDYCELQYGQVQGILMCTAIWLVHVPLLLGVYLAYQWLVWGPRSRMVMSKKEIVVMKSLRAFCLITLLIIGTLALLLTVTYGETIFLMMLLLLPWMFASYGLPAKSPIRKPVDLFNKSLKRLYKRFDTEPAKLKVTGGYLMVPQGWAADYQAQKLQQDSRAEARARTQAHNQAKDAQRRKEERDELERNQKQANLQNVHPDVQAPKYEEKQIKKSGPEWTRQQQQALEKALRKYPVGTRNRWDKVSEEVGDKTPKQCATRFQELAHVNTTLKQGKAG
eukprot:TRINITY_DN63639_c1_g1_i1.p1 TRINITY_DN63639_c1_g1~~TRINITY_DN63639_c1_g1_i1.p1  ORF type:complete len:403 (+),score=1.53 TRINITY_DN63639_c1_g1_i1:33-1241(+)